MQELACRLGLHPLAVEDAVQAHQRPKRERYWEVLAVALKTLWYVEDGCEVKTGEVMVFTGPQSVLTVRHGPDRSHVRGGPEAQRGCTHAAFRATRSPSL
ncbi:magnesium transporter CorA family protein [Streptomyces avermitilis]|uniref:hypothetical protein n=1 Tax=Streptomyces avermitilis TaxID=33903 RepID=UPI00380294DC